MLDYAEQRFLSAQKLPNLRIAALMRQWILRLVLIGAVAALGIFITRLQ